MTRRSPRPLSQRLRSLYSWHRWLGLAAAVFVLLFASTGLLLNHSSSLALDQHSPTSDIWHRLYRLQTTVDIRSMRLGDHWLSHSEGRLYFNTRFVTTTPAPLGAVASNGLWVVANPGGLLLLSPQGLLLEQIGPEQLPGRLIGIHPAAEGIRLDTAYAAFTGDVDSLGWKPQPVAPQATQAIESDNAPDALLRAIAQDVRAHRISWERILLDLHSGHLFGLAGVILMDSAAIALIALALSGPWLWLRLRRKLRRRRQRLQQP